MKSLIVITGPTGVGKTELCLRVANTFRIPIINADSRQIYREIPIGTAAPTAEEQAQAKHYFVGTLSVSDYYSASNYEQDVLRLLDRLFADSDVALLSGGSMMYIDAVCKGIDDIPTIRDDIRRTMKERLATEGHPLSSTNCADWTLNTGPSSTATILAASSTLWRYVIRPGAPTPPSAPTKQNRGHSESSRLASHDHARSSTNVSTTA